MVENKNGYRLHTHVLIMKADDKISIPESDRLHNHPPKVTRPFLPFDVRSGHETIKNANYSLSNISMSGDWVTNLRMDKNEETGSVTDSGYSGSTSTGVSVFSWVRHKWGYSSIVFYVHLSCMYVAMRCTLPTH